MIENIQSIIDEQAKILESSSEFKSICLQSDVNERMVLLKCKYTDIYDCKDKVAYGVLKTDEDAVKKEIETWVNNIIEGVKAVRELNDIIKMYQKANNCQISIYYKFGYDLKDNVKIIDWDYNKIIVKLNKKAICNLISYINNIDEIINLKDYDCSLVKFIERFNGIKLHKIIGASVEGNTIEILKSNMLSRAEVIKKIEENRNNKGVQKFKSVFSLDEIDLLAIFLWNVDFDSGIIETTLMDEKILSIQDDMFIRDENICKAIHNLYEIKAKELFSIFNKY